jgi:hypothetical protein
MNQFVYFNIPHHMLALASTCQVHEPITMSLAFDAQLIINSINICLLKESLRAWGHLLASLSLNRGLRDRFRGVHVCHGHPESFPFEVLLFSNRFIQL